MYWMWMGIIASNPVPFFIYLSSSGWGKIKLKLTTLVPFYISYDINPHHLVQLLHPLLELSVPLPILGILLLAKLSSFPHEDGLLLEQFLDDQRKHGHNNNKILPSSTKSLHTIRRYNNGVVASQKEGGAGDS